MRQLDVEKWSRIVGMLYEASADAAHWPEVLCCIAHTFGAKSAVLRTVRTGPHRDVHATYHYNMHDPLQQDYEGGLVQEDPYLEVLDRVPTGRMVTNDNMIDLEALRHTEFYRSYMCPLDNHFIVGGILERHEDEACSLIGLHRHSNAARFDNQVLAALQTLAPHLRRALWLQRTMQRSAQRAAAAEAALDGIGVACFLLDDTGRLTHTNGVGEALIRDDTRFRLSGGRLLAAAPQCGGGHEPLIELLSRPDMHPLTSNQPLLLRSPDNHGPHLVAISAPAQGAVSGSRADTAVYVGNLDETGVLDASLLRELYGLTPAEANLAIGLGRGSELAQIADDWAVSRETLRTHLKRVLAKTGTSRQVELIRLICGKPWAATGGRPDPERQGSEPGTARPMPDPAG
ncbi:helix-turn-helix transcriptional regulator [Ectothiorhodospiraceae bacterium WFHF3C12]|nr:helix-turn-helix transcriptional regulator [Ectothiorhodospiraceae bacterium WFHF3C12]